MDESSFHAQFESNDFVVVQFLPRTGGPVGLTYRSIPVEVKAWLEEKGFSNM